MQWSRGNTCHLKGFVSLEASLDTMNHNKIVCFHCHMLEITESEEHL